MRPFLLLGALSLALPMQSCTLALSVKRSTTEEVVREPLGTSISVAAERRQDDLHVAVRRSEHVRISTFDVHTIERRRKRLDLDAAQHDSSVVIAEILLPLKVVAYLGCGIAAPFRDDTDVALGPLGVLLAVVVPGITLWDGHLEGDIWDVSVDRRPKGSREVTEHEMGIVTSLRVVTDREVIEVETDAQGIATIPLDRLFGPEQAPGRVTIGLGEALTVVRFDGEVITVTPSAR